MNSVNKNMKKTLPFIVCSLLMAATLCSCTPDNSSKSNTKISSSSQTQKVDYSNNPYVGLAGSAYRIERGTTNDYAIMMFWFYADGSGAWGYNRNGSKEIHNFHYTISGSVNVAWVRDDTNEWGSGYFATFSDIGQCYVTEGMYLARYS